MTAVKDQRYVVAYILHDPEANIESYISDFDRESLVGAEESGMIIIAEHNDGSRKRVRADEVVEPDPRVNGISLATPAYVDKRTAATVACFDALAAIVDPQPATADETGEEVALADPVETFKAALAALKALGVTADE